MVEQKGLSSDHHGELNKKDASAKRFDDLRKLYADNLIAVWQIDTYDASSEVGRNTLAYRDALESGDHKRATKLLDWLESHDPQIEK